MVRETWQKPSLFEKSPVPGSTGLPHRVVPEIIIRLPDEGIVVDGMLIGVMSDTHDDSVQTKKAVSRFNREGVEQVLHAGDFVSPFMIDTLKELRAPLTGVFGNNDGDRRLLERKSAGLLSMKIEGTFARIDAGGMRIALLHGNDRELLETLAACGSLDLLVYGHTHRPEVRTEGSLLIVNPGEVYGHLTGRSTVALVDTVKRSAEIVEL
jgi:putative phosphoesterase